MIYSLFGANPDAWVVFFLIDVLMFSEKIIQCAIAMCIQLVIGFVLTKLAYNLIADSDEKSPDLS